MNPAKLQIMTWVVVISCVFILIFWDIFDKIADPSGNTTISWQIWLTSGSRPVVAFVAGFVCGHLFWQTPDTPLKKIWRKVQMKFL